MSVAKLISDITVKKVNDSRSQKTRNYYILNELMIAVANDPTNLMKIISVLKGHCPDASDISEEIITGKTVTQFCT